jgi:hypothetical protein
MLLGEWWRWMAAGAGLDRAAFLLTGLLAASLLGFGFALQLAIGLCRGAAAGCASTLLPAGPASGVLLDCHGPPPVKFIDHPTRDG